MAFDRQWLRDQVKGYLHDGQVDAHVDTWIDIAVGRIANVLQCYEMEGDLTLGLTVLDSGELNGGDAVALPGNFIDGGDAYGDAVEGKPFFEMTNLHRRLLGVQWQNSQGIWENLRSVPRHEASRYKVNGSPRVYLVENRRVYPLPYQNGNYRAQMLFYPLIGVTADSTNDTLESYPYIFLNAALTEAYDWKQDEVMHQRYESKWLREAQEVTSVYLGDRTGDTPSMRAM